MATHGVSRSLAWLTTRKRRVLVVALLAMFALMLVSFACSSGTGGETKSVKVEDVVKAKTLEIVDNTGATRVLLTTLDSGQPSLTFVDKDGNFRAWLFLGDNGSPNLVLADNPRFALMDEAGGIRSVQRLDDAGTPVLSMMDGSGRVRSMLGLAADGSPVFELYDASGKPVASQP